MSSRFQEIADYLVRLQKKAQKISHESVYSENNLRHRAFLHTLGVVQPLIIIWNILKAVDSNQISDNVCMSLFGMKKEWASNQFRTLNSFSGISLVLQFHFGLEIFLKIILSKFQSNVPPEFYKIAHQLIEKISISDKDNKTSLCWWIKI